MRGIERRIEAGLDPAVASVASIFISRWDVAVQDTAPAGSATSSGSRSPSAPTAPTANCSTPSAGRGSRTRARGRSGCSSPAPGPRIPTPPTSSTSRRWRRRSRSTRCPSSTLHAFADHGEIGEPLAADGGDAERALAEFAEAGIEVEALAARLQEEGKQAFDKSWRELLGTIEEQKG